MLNKVVDFVICRVSGPCQLGLSTVDTFIANYS